MFAPALRQATAQVGYARFERGRFTVVAHGGDETLARSLLASAVANDTFPGLPRPRARVLISIAPDRRTFREWIGSELPEWGAAFAFPSSNRIVMQGSAAPSQAGDPLVVLRHELAHLALAEALGDLAPRWFDEGYASFAAGEWERDEIIATNVALALGGMPTLAGLDSGFAAGSAKAEASYALAYRAVAELAELDRDHGLSLFFTYWRESGSFDTGVRHAYGLTQSHFEQRWRDRTRRRYGGLALFADVTIAATVMVVLFAPLYVRRRRRDKARMAALVAADADAERRDRESAIEQLLKSIAPPSPQEPTPPDSSA
jgi:hypothetical protein